MHTRIREAFRPADGAAREPRVLLVRGIDAEAAEVLGYSLNLDPSFIARHMGSDKIWARGDPRLTLLTNAFSEFLSGHGEAIFSPVGDGSLMEISPAARLTKSDVQWLTPCPPGSFGDCGIWVDVALSRWEGQHGHLNLRISHCQVAEHGCKFR